MNLLVHLRFRSNTRGIAQGTGEMLCVCGAASIRSDFEEFGEVGVGLCGSAVEDIGIAAVVEAQSGAAGIGYGLAYT